ncbi:hypothetical protein [Robiginitalea sp. SC105]|uniref:hypothetical protein n=1 Tax=Robiginitalea sp. SC105 TaxID=2762332 RepID=UPI00163A2C46|nr:hypothetical protein [Robiginitalea sp. SC105]MBC2840076.1 hypothetical protein [Robiginitalea sp. SC105]
MEEFYALGEITISIAGFAALFSILRPGHKNWTVRDSLNLIRFYMMIEVASIITIFSFLPVILQGYFEIETSFRVSSGLYLLTMILYQVFALKRNKRHSGKIAIGGNITVIVILYTHVIMVFALLQTLGFLGNNHKTNYLVLLFATFIFNIYLFIRLIYFTVRKE